MVNSAKFVLLFAALSGLVACQPKFSDRFSEVTAGRVLAVQSSPAEAAPSDKVSYRLLVVDATGTIQAPTARWSYCTQAKPVNELNDVSALCFGDTDVVQPFGMGGEPTGKVPVNACRQFGPDLPQTKPGAPQGRPTDPDSTGGYYQPVILHVDVDSEDVPTLGETRITCGLAGSTSEQFQDYKLRTKTNENPVLSQVTIVNQGDAPLTEDTAESPLVVSAGQRLSLRASWPACPTTAACGDGICSPLETIKDCPDDCTKPVGCGGSEPYAYLDPVLRTLVDRHETMRVSWFASGGSFGSDHTGRSEADFAETTSDNDWDAPSQTGPVFLWVVLRDDRGGVAWKNYRLDVQ